MPPDQEALLTEIRARYLSYGLSTEPADRPRAEAAMARAYRRIGRDPVPVIWVDSPLTASILIHVLEEASSGSSLGESLRGSLRRSLREPLRYSLGDSLRESLGQSLRGSLRRSLLEPLRESLGQSLWGSLLDSLLESPDESLGDSLRESLLESLRKSLRYSLRESLWGSLREPFRESWESLLEPLRLSLWGSLRKSLEDSHIYPQCTAWTGSTDLYWVACYQFGVASGVQYDAEAADGLDIMDEIGQSCGWWYPRDGVCIACERPEVLCTEPHGEDGRLRLHCGDGPAVRFRDGWSIYAWHGVRLDGEIGLRIIEDPDSLTRDELMGFTNVEVRRALVQRIGSDRYAEMLDLDEVHRERWGHPEIPEEDWDEATLLRTRQVDPVTGQHIQFVRVSCPTTGRVYHLCVPESVRTAREAVAWTFRMTSSGYAPDREA